MFLFPQDQIDGRNLLNLGAKSFEMATSPDGTSPATSPQENTNIAYRPVYKHWFYNQATDNKAIWAPFSMTDSMNLEDAFVAESKCFHCYQCYNMMNMPCRVQLIIICEFIYFRQRYCDHRRWSI